MKKVFYLALLFFLALLAGCSKDNSNYEGGTPGGGGGGGGGFSKNKVTLGSNTYTIESACYSVEDGSTTIQFGTSEPDVFLYFQDRSSIPVGNFNVSYDGSDDNCVITYYFENTNYLSIDGTLKIALNNSVYTIEAEGHLTSHTDGEQAFTIYYKGEIQDVSQGGSGGGGNNGGFGGGGGSQTNDSFKIGPAFSYFHCYGGEGKIHVYCDNENVGWSVSCDSDWCLLTIVNGIGDGSVPFFVTYNNETHNVDRTAKMTFRSIDGKTIHHAYVHQKPGSYDLEVSPNHHEFSAYGGDRTVHITINNGDEPLHWTATCNASWVHLSETEGDWSTSLNVTVEQGNEQRSAEIKIKSANGTVRNVIINQKAPEEIKISVDQVEYQYYVETEMAFQVRYHITNSSKSYTLYYIKFTVRHPSGAVTTHSVGSPSNPYGWNLPAGSSTWTGYYDCNIHVQSGSGSTTITDALFY